MVWGSEDVCNRPIALVSLPFGTLDGSFFACRVLILTPLSRVLDLLHCNIKRYKSTKGAVPYPVGGGMGEVLKAVRILFTKSSR